jgi:acetone carboxylase gamma subunit
MWLSVRVSVVKPADRVERRTLCPSCGTRPRWAATVTRNEEIVEKNWWCPQCSALIQLGSPTTRFPHVLDHYTDVVPKKLMN